MDGKRPKQAADRQRVMMAGALALLARHHDKGHGGQYEANDCKADPHLLPDHAKGTGGIDGHLDWLSAKGGPKHSKTLRQSHKDRGHSRRQVTRGDIGGANEREDSADGL